MTSNNHIHLSENSFPAEVEPPLTPSSSQRSGDQAPPASGSPVTDNEFVQGLVNDCEFEYLGGVITESSNAARSRSSETDEPATLEFDVDVSGDHGVIVLLEQSGKYSWHYSDSNARRVSRSPQSAHFSIPLDPNDCLSRLEPHVGRKRSFKRFIGERLLGKAKAFVLQFASRTLATHATGFLERKTVERAVVIYKRSDKSNRQFADQPSKWMPEHALRDFARPRGRECRALLLVHGTFSSTEGSFDGLAKCGLLSDAAKKYDLILGFDHRTLSETPADNATSLLGVLEEYKLLKGIRFDAIAFSRGGLVLRCLVETLLGPHENPFEGGKLIFVGCTNAGTQLANPDNWHAFLDLYTSVMTAGLRFMDLITGSGMGTIGSKILGGLAAFAKTLATEALDREAIPGLAAMAPSSRTVTELNDNDVKPLGPTDVQYYAIKSNFEPSVVGSSLDSSSNVLRNLAMALIDSPVDQLLGEDNDLVVHTRSMNAVGPKSPEYFKETFQFPKKQRVFHTVYFAQTKTASLIYRWLDIEGEAKSLRPNRHRTTQTRTRSSKNQARLEEQEWIDQFFEEFEGEDSPPPVTSPEPDPLSKVNIIVEWGDIQRAKGSIFAAGHYIGVSPIRAELAIDRLASGLQNSKMEESDRRHLVITRLAERRLLDGSLGKISFFPWAANKANGAPTAKNRIVAVCGMGHPGEFNEFSATTLYRNLFTAVGDLAGRDDVTTVLIGSGEGNLSFEHCLTALLKGLDDAVHAGAANQPITTVRIVERYKHRALEIYDALSKLIVDHGESGPGLSLQFEPEVEWSEPEDAYDHGKIHSAHLLIDFLTKAAQSEMDHGLPQKAINKLVRELTPSMDEVDQAEFLNLMDGAWFELRQGMNSEVHKSGHIVDGKPSRRDLAVARIAGRASAMFQPSNEDPIPTRISCIRDGAVLRLAAITNSTTVPEVVVKADPELLREIATEISESSDMDRDELGKIGGLLTALLISPRFRSLLPRNEPLILELDSQTAGIPWEVIMDGSLNASEQQPLALLRPISRQLRTTYSASPAVPKPRSNGRALVIGAPGTGSNKLPGAQREAEEVQAMLRKRMDVTLLNGSKGTRPQVLQALYQALHDDCERYDLIHFAGHGVGDPTDPSKSGWVVADGKLITAAELDHLEPVPPIIVANACHSGVVSDVRIGNEQPQMKSHQLLPTLANEFFRKGAQHYLGTGWQVDDQGAVKFAKLFYRSFLEDAKTIGDSIVEARRKLAQDGVGPLLWASYQHYGDPGFRWTDLSN